MSGNVNKKRALYIVFVAGKTGAKDMKFSIVKRETPYFFENMHEDLNRFLRDSFSEFSAGDIVEKAWRPALEVKETKDEYKIKAELPGLNKENIDVSLHENYVTIKGETQKCEEKDNENTHISEFRYGKFFRSIPLDKSINVSESNAEFKDGILHIDLKKQQIAEQEVKKLTIK